MPGGGGKDDLTSVEDDRVEVDGRGGGGGREEDAGDFRMAFKKGSGGRETTVGSSACDGDDEGSVNDVF